MRKNFFWILLILVFSFLIRAYNFSFPYFTAEEARVAYRGYTLATYGKDELGRPFPLIFNSLDDYQLPLVSYITAGGEIIFGKSEFGARIPFLVLGTALVFLIYKISLAGALVTAFSPALIFLSKAPNEAIVLTFLFTLLFYLLINKKKFILIILTMILSSLTSKQAWLILIPFTFFTLNFYQKSIDRKRKYMLIFSSVLIVFLAYALFFNIPQSKRSLFENNFTIFSDITIKNGINKLRGQGLESGWPQAVDRLLFNKSHFLITGSMHWLSHLNPAIYFGQFDSSGKLNYSYLGAWPKILIIPFIAGLFFLIKEVDKKKRLLIIYFLLLTFPSIFIYPNLSLDLVIITLPFMAQIIAFGFRQFSKRITAAILSLVILELAINVFNPTHDYKNTTALRPSWVKQLVNDIFEKSNVFKTAVSDDITSDITSYIEWYTPINPQIGFQPISSPYKFRQYKLANIKIVGSDESYNSCGTDEKVEVFASARDINKIRHEFEVPVVNTYQNSIGEDKAYRVEKVCIK